MIDPMLILQSVFGNKAIDMVNQWNNMTTEQKQFELMKVANMSNEQRMTYLQNIGVSPNLLNNITKQTNDIQTINTNTSRFNY